MKTNKRAGISLIVLVITIIVMIILAATIVLSLNNSGIIEKANKAKTDTDNATLLEAASVAYAEYDLAVKTGETVTGTAEEYVKNNLKGKGFTDEQLGNLEVTDDGKITIGESQVVLKEFTVQDCDDASYSAADGISWETFVSTDYNDGKFSIDTDGGTDSTGNTYDYPIVTFNSEVGTDWLWLDGNPVNAASSITFDASYSVGQFGVYDCQDDF